MEPLHILDTDRAYPHSVIDAVIAAPQNQTLIQVLHFDLIWPLLAENPKLNERPELGSKKLPANV